MGTVGASPAISIMGPYVLEGRGDTFTSMIGEKDGFCYLSALRSANNDGCYIELQDGSWTLFKRSGFDEQLCGAFCVLSSY